MAEGRTRISYIEDDDVLDVFKALSQATKMGVSELIREATRDYADKVEEFKSKGQSLAFRGRGSLVLQYVPEPQPTPKSKAKARR